MLNHSDVLLAPQQNSTAITSSLAQQELTLQCPSSCIKDPAINRTPELPEVPEIPENVDMTDSNATIKQQMSESNKINGVPFVEYNTSAPTIAAPSITINASPIFSPLNGNVNKLSATDNNDEDPVEIRDTASVVVQPRGPSQPTVSTQKDGKVVASSVNVAAETVDSKVSNVAISPEIPLTATQAPVSVDLAQIRPANDSIVGAKRNDNANSTRTNKDDSVEASPISAQVVAIGSPIIPVSAAAAAAVSSCLIVQVMLRTDAFNATLGSDLICPHSDGGGHSFNITYNVPLSKFMKENHFELLFV